MNEDSCDVCIVGAGACGAMIAAHLSRAGARVCVIEAGPRWVPERDFVADERNGKHLMFPSTAIATGSAPLGTLGGMGLGGGTVNYRGASYRMLPSDFDSARSKGSPTTGRSTTPRSPRTTNGRKRS